jgi:type IV secretion system protein TrbI
VADQISSNDPTIPRVTERSVRPRGVLPKNVQAWVILGLSTLMIVVLAVSGRKNTKENPAEALPRPQAIADPSQARIEEYRKRIEEESRKLASEQERLRRVQADLAGQAQTTGQTPPEIQPQPSYQHPAYYEPREASKTETNTIERDRKRREYESLFASNISLSHRANETSGREVAPKAGGSDQPVAILQGPLDARPAVLPQLPVPTASVQAAGESHTAVSPLQSIQNPPGPAGSEGATETGQLRQERSSSSKEEHQSLGIQSRAPMPGTYRLYEGTVLETVLTNRLTSLFSGPANCMVTVSVWSRDRQHLLIPQGTKVLGQVAQTDSFGQERLAVFFHRMIMPDGFSVRLDRFQGLNQVGETGLKDKVDRHYTRIFGMSIAIGAIAGLARAGTRYGIDVSSGDIYRQEASRSMADSSLRILDRYLNVMPTFTIREGHRVRIYLSSDVDLPPYEAHARPDALPGQPERPVR